MYYPRNEKALLGRIVKEIVECLNPEYVLIAGSFGKESWVFDEDVLLSDFELVFICQEKWSLNKKKKLLYKLNANYDVEISLKGYLLSHVEQKIISNYSKKNLGYLSLDFYDTFSEISYLYNRNNEPLKVKCYKEEIPSWEAWRLIVNRIGDLLQLGLFEEGLCANYLWLKIFESIADAYLITRKQYASKIEKRVLIFNELDFDLDNKLSGLCKGSTKYLKQALQARLENSINVFQLPTNKDENYDIVSDWLVYFQNILIESEQLNVSNTNFYEAYVSSKNLQKKYLGINENYSINVSNIIRLISNRNLINSNFKFYNMINSWRHMILLLVSAFYLSNYGKYKNNYDTVLISKQLFKLTWFDSLLDDQKLEVIINYWKKLR